MPRLCLLVGRWALALGFMAMTAAAVAQSPALWPEGKKAAIVLTYDDSARSQLDVAIPQLDAAGLKGTFFLNGTFASGDLERWRRAAASGHELGNHSTFHPCPAAAFPAEKQFHTENYSIAGMLRDIAAMNNLLLAIDGRKSRTYATPCSQSVVGGQDYIVPLRDSGLVDYVRTGGTGDGIIADPRALDPFKVPSRGFAEQHRASDLIGFAEQIRKSGGMGIFMFHGVGGDHLAVSAETHQALIDYLKLHHHQIWVATFQQVMDVVTSRERP